MSKVRKDSCRPRQLEPETSCLRGALAQIDSVLGSGDELRVWDPEGWRLLRAACFDLQDALEKRLEETRQSNRSTDGPNTLASREISEALSRVRIYLDRLSLPKPAWEGWWATACRLKLLEARLRRDRGSKKMAVA